MDEQIFDFNTEFMSDEEVEEMLDSLVVTIGNEIEADNSNVAIINPYKVQQILYTYKVLKYLTKGTKAKVSYELHKPFRSMGYVRVVGRNLTIKNTDWFMRAVELASNFEAYPKTDGTVQMDFTFHGVTKTLN